MREFTKSIFSFSWALSLFGLQQTANLLTPAKAARAFDAVTQATEGQISDPLKMTFNTANNLQRSAVDMAAGILSGEALNPSRFMRMASDAAKQSADAVTKGVQGVTSTVQQAASAAVQTNPGQPAGFASATGCSDASEPQGWGPKPS